MSDDPKILAVFGDEPVLSRSAVALGGAVARLMGIILPAITVALTASYPAAFGSAVWLSIPFAIGRARFTTNFRVMRASAEHLELVAPDGSTTAIPWDHVVAIECWRSVDGRTDLSIHLSFEGERRVARVWARESAATLHKFLDCCAARVPFRESRIGPLASLEDPSVREPLVRELVLDAALAAVAAVCGGLYARLPWLSVALLSPVIAIAWPAASLIILTLLRVRVRSTSFELSPAGWAEQRTGSSRVRATLPRGLRAWGEALLRHHPSDSQQAPYRSAS